MIRNLEETPRGVQPNSAGILSFRIRLRFRLRLFPFGAGDFLDLVLEDEHALLVADHDVRVFGVADDSGGNLSADAGVIVNQMGDVFGLAFGRAHQFEPIEHGG